MGYGLHYILSPLSKSIKLCDESLISDHQVSLNKFSGLHVGGLFSLQVLVLTLHGNVGRLWHVRGTLSPA
jgi:hypothetical protein